MTQFYFDQVGTRTPGGTDAALLSEPPAGPLPAGVLAWPDELPVALLQGWGFVRVDGRRVTDMDQGPARVRRVYKNTPRQATMNFLMNDQQFEAFEQFFYETANEGTSAIRMPAKDERGVRFWDVQVLAVGGFQAEGLHWRFSLQVQTV